MPICGATDFSRVIRFWLICCHVFAMQILHAYLQVRHYNESMLAGGFLPHPGVGHMMPGDEIKRHAYYQWVPFLLVIQAICFYAPHFLWRLWEGTCKFTF